MPASVLVGIAMTRFGKFRWALWSGWTCTTLGSGLLILLDAYSPPTYGWVLILLVNGLGLGLLLNSLNLATNAVSSTADVAYASTMYAFLRGVGLCLGVAIGGSAFQNRLRTILEAAGLPTSIAKDAEAYVATLKRMPKADKFRTEITKAYAEAFHTVFIVLTTVSAAGLVITILGIKDHTMDKSIETEHRLQHHQKVSVTPVTSPSNGRSKKDDENMLGNV
jgi:hypothetical protein